MNTSRTVLTAAVLAALAPSVGLGAGSTPSTPTSDSGVAPAITATAALGGNVSCEQLGYDGSTGRIDADDPDFRDSFLAQGLTVSVEDETQVRWTSEFDIRAAIVKGGPAANIYLYSPALRSDSGLASPVNASGTSAALSNLTFCFDAGTGEPEGPGEPETESGNPPTPESPNNVRRPVVQPVAGAPQAPAAQPAPAPQPMAIAPASAAPQVAPAALRASIRGTTRVRRGGFVVYRITVKNVSSEVAHGVRFRNTPPATMRWRAVPAGATFVARARAARTTSKASAKRSARAPKRTKAAAWSVRSLAPGASITRTVRMKMTNKARGRSCTVLVASAGNARASRSRACTRVMAGARRAAAPVAG